MWLNEGFAVYHETLATWNIYNKTASLDQLIDAQTPGQYFHSNDLDVFMITKLNIPIIIDRSNGPIVKKGRSIFETVGYVYSKGAMFLRMMIGVWGRQKFQELTQDLISKYKYQNYETEEFFSFLNEKANPFQGTSVSSVFYNWLTQEGYPIVNVTRCYEPHCINQLNFQQKRYQFYFGQPNINNDMVWHIPIQYAIIIHRNGQYQWTTANGKDHFLFLMPPTRDKVTHNVQNSINLGPQSAVIVNINYNGMYHVLYDERNWKNIGAALMENHRVIPMASRLQFLELLKRHPTGRKYGNLAMLLCIGEYLKVR